MSPSVANRGMRTFSLIWFGQLVSLTGSGLTGFALGVWVYQRSGSVTLFALISLFTALPGIIFSPVAGALVDRWDRRWAMLISDAGAAACTLSMAILMMASRLEVWHIYLAMGISSTFSAFQWPAYSAATTLLVPKAQLGRASGMVQIAEAFAQIIAPVLAGSLMGLIQVYGVMLVDFATFLVAVSTLLVVRIPKPQVTEEGKEGKGTLLREATFGWRYIRARPGLMGLLLFFAVTNFTIGIMQVLFTPLVLSFNPAATLGLLLSIAGLGFLMGGLLMSAWGGPKRRIYGILGASLMQGVALMIAGVRQETILLGFGAYIAFFSLPIINGCSQAIWQTKTAPDLQGRVFSVRRMIAWASLPLAYLMAGPLADTVFEPWMAEGGLLAGSIGSLIGVGEGRGIGLMALLLGVMNLLAVLAAYLNPRVLRVELELPDAIDDKPAAPSG